MSALLRLTLTCALMLLPLSGVALAEPAELRAAVVAPAPQQAPEEEVRFAPVEIDGEVLFNVRGSSSLPAEQRAGLIEDRIRDLADDSTFDPATLKVEEVGGASRIGAPDGRLVMNVYDADSLHEGFSREGVAAFLVQHIQQAIVEYRAARTPDALLGAALHGLGALAVTVLAMLLVLWASRRMDGALERRYRPNLPALGIGSFEIVRADRIWSALHGLVGLLRWAACLTLVFFGLRYAMALFPQTHALASGMANLVAGPLERLGLDSLAVVPDLIFLAILFLIARWLLRLTLMFFRAVETGNIKLRNFEPEWAIPTYRLVRTGLVAFALIVAYPSIPGANSAAFKGVTLFLGVLVSLGSSSAISNIIAGYMLIYRRAFRIGDRVRIGETLGDVTEMRLQVTHVRTIKNETVTIPNSTILSSQVINYSTLAASEGLIVPVLVGIGYETPWRQVEAMLLEAAARTKQILQTPKPFVEQLALGDFAVTYELNVYCDKAQIMPPLRTELQAHVLDVFNEYGVQIMTPAYEYDPDQPKLVPREQWYAAPAKPPDGGPARAGS